ncbi:MAG TPA: ribosome maturation factor RimM [Anaerolineales bacterium]|nr:ribosome maturation factor RimM [Anaerolineales bacterium]
MAGPDGPDDFIVVGRIGRPHGVKGEVRLKILTDFPERLVAGKQVYLGENKAPVTILGLRGAGDSLILSLAGVSDRIEAGLLRSTFVYVHLSEVPDLPEGEFYSHDLIGLEVITELGETLGRISEILYTGANDVLVVVGEGGIERLLPAIDDVILSIDLEASRVLVRLLPGL